MEWRTTATRLRAHARKPLKQAPTIGESGDDTSSAAREANAAAGSDGATRDSRLVILLPCQRTTKDKNAITMPTIKVLVADDTTLFRRLIARDLAREADIAVVGEAEDGRQAVELTGTLCPDVVLMDLSMPHLNGAQATEQIVARHPRVRVILLTGHDELAALGRFTGAQETLNKNCTPRELVAAIRRVHAAAPSEANATGTDANALRGTIERLAVRANLTEREKAVVEKMVDTELTSAQIARLLSQERGEAVTESAVKHAMERAVIKLNVEPRTRSTLIKYVMEFDRGK
jgi:DNA-binding NarL/FixJ family response regulator